MTAITILDHANTPMGPFTREEVAGKLRRGEVTLSSLAFVEGLTQWTPLRDVLAKVDAANPPPVAIAAPPAPAPAAVVSAPIAPAPNYSYAATMEPPAHLVYAGFWLRFVAHFIDTVLLIAVDSVLLLIWYGLITAVGDEKFLGYHPPSETTPQDAGGLLLLAILELGLVSATIGTAWLYQAGLESSSWQGTLGKRALNLRVTGMAGERVGFWRATARFLSKVLSSVFFVGYIMAAFTGRKQALHDMLASTLVVRNS